MKNCLTLFFAIVVLVSEAQTGIIKGKITESGGKPVEFATVIIDGTQTGTQTDENGNFSIDKLAPGTYNIKVTSVGFTPKVVFEIGVTNSKPAVVEIEMESSSQNLQEVIVKANQFVRKEESPVYVM